MRRLIPLLLVLSMINPGVASGDCTIAAYADPTGTRSIILPELEFQGDTFPVYVVIFAEDTVAAAAYRIRIQDLGVTVFLVDLLIGPSGQGLVIEEPTGTNAALTECVYGFDASPVLVAEYRLQPILGAFSPGNPFVTIEANTSQGDTSVYVTCNNEIKPCAPGPDLAYVPLDNESSSFGSIKALYFR